MRQLIADFLRRFGDDAHDALRVLNGSEKVEILADCNAAIELVHGETRCFAFLRSYETLPGFVRKMRRKMGGFV